MSVGWAVGPHLGPPQAQVTSGHAGSGPREHPSLGVVGSHSPPSVSDRLSLCR